MMKKIALIYMGGTFGCIGEPLSPMPAKDFLPQLEKILDPQLNIECFIAPVIQDSSACTASDWLALTQQIQQLQKAQFQHFVIIHGTDTLSYASAVLAQFLAQSARIVLTGSQYPLLNVAGNATRQDSDALDNLNFALKAVLDTSAGVYLAFHQRLIHAATALKQHTTALDAFAGVAANTSLLDPHAAFTVSDTDIAQSQNFNALSVMMQPIHLNAQWQNLKQISQRPPHFLFLQGFGTANLAVDADIIALLDEFYAQGCAVVLTTQVPFGAIEQHYAINHWLGSSKILLSDCQGHADLYAKALKMYLQYDGVDQWYAHWQG